MHVLLVEDDKLLPSRRIQIASMVVDTAGFSEDDLSIAKLYDYDIIVLDLVLPGMERG
jgi:DNA-binding response OmpR family regulator